LRKKIAIIKLALDAMPAEPVAM
jgi:hypothetical protein